MTRIWGSPTPSWLFVKLSRFASLISRLILALLATVALAVSAAPPTPAETQFTAEPQMSPTWHPAYSRAFPGCHRKLPAHTIPDSVLLSAPDGMVTRVPFAQAWRSTHARGNVAVVVGLCS